MTQVLGFNSAPHLDTVVTSTFSASTITVGQQDFTGVDNAFAPNAISAPVAIFSDNCGETPTAFAALVIVSCVIVELYSPVIRTLRPAWATSLPCTYKIAPVTLDIAVGSGAKRPADPAVASNPPSITCKAP